LKDKNPTYQPVGFRIKNPEFIEDKGQSWFLEPASRLNSLLEATGYFLINQ